MWVAVYIMNEVWLIRNYTWKCGQLGGVVSWGGVISNNESIVIWSVREGVVSYRGCDLLKT